MAFDSSYTNGSILAIARNFVQAANMSFSPEARDDDSFLGVNEIRQMSQAVSNIDSKVQEDFITALGTIGYESDMVFAISQGGSSTVRITETEFTGTAVERSRITIPVKGISAKLGTATGPTTSIYAPSLEQLASMAVILESAALPVCKNQTFRYTRVRNSTGGTLTAGTAVVFAGNTNGLIDVAATAGGSSTERIIGILAEDIPTTETGACFTGGGAALIPRAVAVAASAANETACYVAASGALDSSGTLVIGRWKHVGGAGTASILQLNPTP